MCVREREREREREGVYVCEGACCWHHDTHTHTHSGRDSESGRREADHRLYRVCRIVFPQSCLRSTSCRALVTWAGLIFQVSIHRPPVWQTAQCSLLFSLSVPRPREPPRARRGRKPRAKRRRRRSEREGEREREKERDREKARVDTRLSQSRLSRIVPTLLPPPPSSPTHPPCLP